jgi:hypothetical protein
MANRAPLSVAPRRGDWTQQELGEIDRIRAVCEEHPGFAELECSHTDEGDPWCIVYVRNSGRIILHIARIDRCYVIVAPRQAMSSRSTSMTDAVEIALRQLAHELPAAGSQG